MSVTVKGERYYFRPTGCSQAHWRKIQRERFVRRYAPDMKLARQFCRGELLNYDDFSRGCIAAVAANILGDGVKT